MESKDSLLFLESIHKCIVAAEEMNESLSTFNKVGALFHEDAVKISELSEGIASDNSMRTLAAMTGSLKVIYQEINETLPELVKSMRNTVTALNSSRIDISIVLDEVNSANKDFIEIGQNLGNVGDMLGALRRVEKLLEEHNPESSIEAINSLNEKLNHFHVSSKNLSFEIEKMTGFFHNEVSIVKTVMEKLNQQNELLQKEHRSYLRDMTSTSDSINERFRKEIDYLESILDKKLVEVKSSLDDHGLFTKIKILNNTLIQENKKVMLELLNEWKAELDLQYSADSFEDKVREKERELSLKSLLIKQQYYFPVKIRRREWPEDIFWIIDNYDGTAIKGRVINKGNLVNKNFNLINMEEQGYYRLI